MLVVTVLRTNTLTSSVLMPALTTSESSGRKVRETVLKLFEVHARDIVWIMLTISSFVKIQQDPRYV